MKLTSPEDMNETHLDSILKHIESYLAHQPKNQESYNIQIPINVSSSAIVEIEKNYEDAGWGMVLLTNISENVYNLTLIR